MRNSHVWVFFPHPHQPLSPIAFAFPIPSPPWIFPSFIPPPCPPQHPSVPCQPGATLGLPTPPSSVLSQMYLWVHTHNTCAHTHVCTHTQGENRELVYILLNQLDTHWGHFPGAYWLLHNTGYIEMLGCERTRVPCFPQRWALGCLPSAAACPSASPILVLLSLHAGLSRLCYDQHAPVLTCGPTALTRDKWIPGGVTV